MCAMTVVRFVMTLLLAMLLGWITTRKAGTALAMISLGLGELVWSMALMWPEVFGGEGGGDGKDVSNGEFLLPGLFNGGEEAVGTPKHRRSVYNV